MKKKLIYLMGIDGSGKTTLARNAYITLKAEGINVKYLYARYRPFLVIPVKLFSKIFLYKNNGEFKNYKKYSNIKRNFSVKHKTLALLYAYLCIFDYMIISWPIVMFKYLTSEYLLIDRYVGDLIVTISVASNLSIEQTSKYLKLIHYIFPMPTLSFFIDIDEKIAFNRKDDIPSIQYLTERKYKYYIFKSYYNYTILNGKKSKEHLLDEFLQYIIK